MRVGLRAMLQSSADLQVSAQAAALAELEMELPRLDVIILAGEISSADLHQPPAADLPALLLLSESAGAIAELLDQPWRAWGLLSPDSSTEELVAGVHAVHQGMLVGSPALLLPLFRQQRQALLLSSDENQLPGEALTSREIDVLRCLALGMANKQISRALTISEHTVKFHVSSIYTKLGATNRTEAVRIGVQRGLVAL